MKGLFVELPQDLLEEVLRRAGKEPGGEAAWIAEAVREKLAACDQLEYLEQRGARGSRVRYERILAKVPEAEPTPGDERRP